MQLATSYGMSAATAGARMGKSAEEGEKLMDSFFSKFKKLKETIDQSKDFLLENGYVEDWAGRRRRLTDLQLPDYEVTLAASKKDEEDPTFNPIFGCVDRTVNDPVISTWRDDIIPGFINWTNRWKEEKFNKELQAKIEAFERAHPCEKYIKTKADTFVKTNEMSNETFSRLQKAAANPEKYKNLAWNSKKALGPYNKSIFDTIKERTGVNMPLEPVILSSNTGKKAQAARQCFNARIQGGAASLTKLAMVNIFNNEQLKKLGARLIITVHDEVLVECPAVNADEVEKLLPQIMIDTAKPYINVGMKCDPYNVTRWYIDEYAVSLADELSKLEKSGFSKENAIEKLVNNHIEIPRDAIITMATTREPCDF